MTISSCGASEDIRRVLEEPPNIENRLAAQVKIFVDGMRCAKNKHITAFDDLFDRSQVGVALNERVRGQNFFYMHHERILELIAERRADVVHLRLKGHAQQPDSSLGKITQTAHLVNHIENQALIDQHGCVTQRKLVAGKGRKLHGVFE